MAGAGYKLFNTGDVLTAAQVNTYLMEQSVMVFADAAARTTALSGVVAEGMLSYLKDTNAVEVYNGSAWVASDDPNAIQNTIVDAKGDLIAASANDTPARLAVGNNGETLVADSSQTAGLRYNPPVSSLTNPTINGGFDIWQRGTSGFVPGNNATTFAADRWNIQRGVTGATVSRQTTSDTTNLPNIQYAMRVARDSGNASTEAIRIGNSFESVTSIPFAGKVVTLSFYARKGADYSATTSLLNAELRTGTGTDQNTFGTYTGSATPISSDVTLTATWQRFALTGTVAATATEMALKFVFTPVGTAGAADYYEITGVQIDVGTWTANTAPTFRRAGGTLAGELAACQRYCLSFLSGVSKPFGIGINYTTTSAYTIISYPVTMRTTPTLTAASGTNYYGFFRNTAPDYFNSLTLGDASTTAAIVQNTTEISGTAGDAGLMISQEAASSILFSAEL